jgi:hypothetical protein
MHRLTRPHRTLTAFLAVLALLWSQLALAAYACPGAGHAPGIATDAATSRLSMAERMAAGEPCDGMAERGDRHSDTGSESHSNSNSAQSALCHQHCADAPQSADAAQPPVPTLPVLVQAWPAPLLPVAWAVGAPPPAHRAAQAPRRPPPAPLFLATLRLRV